MGTVSRGCHGDGGNDTLRPHLLGIPAERVGQICWTLIAGFSQAGHQVSDAFASGGEEAPAGVSFGEGVLSVFLLARAV